FICLDIAPDAQNEVTAGIRCADNSCFTLAAPDTVSNTAFPIESKLTLIKSFEDTLDNLMVYPNPWKSGSGVEYIKFERLTENVKIQIYTISGDLILESDADGESEWNWELKNDKDKKIASGLYIYTISNDKGEKKQGKIAVIR
ncbi:MAG: T9SS type A sorting domain-containing protein, partial [bacterium]|nr:T9SS type A sorting domain-containing protein [bacterium]